MDNLKTQHVTFFENFSQLEGFGNTLKNLGFLCMLMFLWELTSISNKSMMFVAKFKYFFHKLSFVQIKQDHGTDLWYQINKNDERLSKITQLTGQLIN